MQSIAPPPYTCPCFGHKALAAMRPHISSIYHVIVCYQTPADRKLTMLPRLDPTTSSCLSL